MIELGQVTKALESVISYAVGTAYSSADFETTPKAPDRADQDQISVHLYHAIESPEYKNMAPMAGSGRVPGQFVPTGLILQYVVSVPNGSASGHNEDTADPFHEYMGQNILGVIARAVKDYPRLSPKAELPQTIQDAYDPLAPYPLELFLRPVKIDEAVSFWGAEQSMTPRVSLFVEVRVAILEPREPEFIPGRVLSIGGGIIPNMGPQLLDGHSKQTFALPEVTGRETETLTARPPQPSLFRTGSASVTAIDDVEGAEKNASVVLIADGLKANRSLLISGPGLSTVVEESPGVFVRETVEKIEVAIDGTSLNTEWNFAASASRLSFDVHTQVDGTLPGSAQTLTFDLAPGSYTVRVAQSSPETGGLTMYSSTATLNLVPQLSGTADATGGLRSVFVQGDYCIHDGVEVGLSVGGRSYTLIDSDDPLTFGFEEFAGTLGEGEFAIFESGDDVELRFQLPADVTPSASNPVAVNVIVNGLPGTPVWLESAT